MNDLFEPGPLDEDATPAEVIEEAQPEEIAIGDSGMTLADVIEETAVVAERKRALSLPEMIDADPESAEKKILLWMEIMPRLQRGAIASTRPIDWVLMRDEKSGRVSGFPRKSACLQIRRFFGVSILRPRNIDTGRAECRVSEYDGTKMVWDNEARRKLPKPVRVRRAEIWVDAVSERTGETVEAIRGVRASNEDFIGRLDQPQDLEESARTAAENKATRLLSGIVTVPMAELAEIWGLTEEEAAARATRGAGFGSSEERSAATKQASPTPAVAQGGTAESFWAHVVAAFNGNQEQAWGWIREAGSFTGEDGKQVQPRDYKQLAAAPKWLGRIMTSWDNSFPDYKFKAKGGRA